jgi:hypothetical protein
MTSLPLGDLRATLDDLQHQLLLRRVGIDPKPKPDYSILFVRLNGLGKHELCVQHPTGAAQIISTEP